MKPAFDMALVQRGARLRRTPFFEATQHHGAKGYTVYNHMLFPIQFDDLEAEYWKLVNEVTLWDVGVERQIQITGPDAFEFTNLLTPRDLSECEVGQAKYVVITAPDGVIINDPVLLRLADDRFWLALADSDVLLWAKGLAHGLGMQVELAELQVAPIQVQGPKSKQVMQALLGEQVLGLKYYHFIQTAVQGMPVIVTRTGWSGEVGFEIYLLESDQGTALWESVMEAGKPYNIAPTGPSDIRRIEAGILNYGADITLEDNPYEVGLGWMVDLDQEADFVGKSALARIAREGPRRKLVGVEIEGERIDFNMTKWPVSAAGATVGRITSAIYSPGLKKNIGYAMLPVEHTELGTELSVAVPDSVERKATVVPRPFVDPDKDIPKN
jgi:aminomethyltransferase